MQTVPEKCRRLRNMARLLTRTLTAMLNRNSSQRLLSYHVAFVFFLAASQGTAATRVWDTMSPSPDEEIPADRSGWRAVPTAGEKWNDPEHYNPENYSLQYSFTGDAAVENERLVAVFSSTKVYPL